MGSPVLSHIHAPVALGQLQHNIGHYFPAASYRSAQQVPLSLPSNAIHASE